MAYLPSSLCRGTDIQDFVSLCSFAPSHKLKDTSKTKFLMLRVVAILAFVFCSLPIFSQTLASAGRAEATAKALTANEGWLLPGPAADKVIYIDLEKISGQLYDVIIRKESGEVVRKESLENLPANTIYEVGYEGLPTGEYSLEVRSFTGGISYRFQIK